MTVFSALALDDRHDHRSAALRDLRNPVAIGAGLTHEKFRRESKISTLAEGRVNPKIQTKS
jgi:hypothetical protein